MLCSLLLIITVIMASLLPIITRSIMGNNGSIITHYRPGQLGDDLVPFLKNRVDGAVEPLTCGDDAASERRNIDVDAVLARDRSFDTDHLLPIDLPQPMSRLVTLNT